MLQNFLSLATKRAPNATIVATMLQILWKASNHLKQRASSVSTVRRMASYEVNNPLRFVAVTIAMLGIVPVGLSTMPGELEASAWIVEVMNAEFMKGFRAIDADSQGAVDFTAMVRTLRAVGYGEAQPVARGRGGGVDPFDRFEALDADGDGILREDEAGPYMRRTEYFEDGEVTLDEYRKAWAELQTRRGSRGGPGGGQGSGGRGSRARGGGGRGGGVQSSDVEFLAGLDANRDRTLTAEEVRRAIEAAVVEGMDARTSLDANKDGEVSPREYSLSQPKTGRPVDEDGLDGHARGHFEREDLDRDGVITAKEIADRVSDRLGQRLRAIQLSLRLASADANGDGTLDPSELGTGKEDSLQTLLDAPESDSLQLEGLYGKLYSASVKKTQAIEGALSTE